MSVCLSVCLSLSYLENVMAKFHQIFWACCLLPCLISLWQRCDCCVLPVLWMALLFHTKALCLLLSVDSISAETNKRFQPNFVQCTINISIYSTRGICIRAEVCYMRLPCLLLRMICRFVKKRQKCESGIFVYPRLLFYSQCKYEDKQQACDCQYDDALKRLPQFYITHTQCRLITY